MAFSLEMILSILRGKTAEVRKYDYKWKPGDERQSFQLPTLDPRVHFLLATHTKTSPRLRILSPNTLEVYMEAASRDYCERSIKFGSRHVILPMLFFWFQNDFLSFQPNMAEATPKAEGEKDRKEGNHGTEELKEDKKVDERIESICVDTTENNSPATTTTNSSITGSILWLTKKQSRRIAKMVKEGRMKIAYEYDWTPSLF